RTSVSTPSLNSSGQSTQSYFDDHFAVAHESRIGSHRIDAGRQNDLAGAHVELPLVKVALDDLAIQKSLRQGAGPVSAVIVGHVIGSVDIEYGEFKPRLLDFKGRARRNIGGVTQFDLRLPLLRCGVSHEDSEGVIWSVLQLIGLSYPRPERGSWVMIVHVAP